MNTPDPDWKALCVALVKSDEECMRVASDPDAYRVAFEVREDARSAMHAAVKEHGDDSHNDRSELISVLDEIVNYRGGADNALSDPYVMERACDLLSKVRP